MIRSLRFNDINQVVIMTDSSFKELGIVPENENNIRHTIDLVKQCHIDGLSYVACDDNKIVGGIGAIFQDNFFCPSISEISIIAIWMDKEYRYGTKFYRLIKEFLENAEGKADKIVASHLPGITNLDFTKLGFELEQQCYVR